MLPLSPESFYFREGAFGFSKTINDVPFKIFSRRSQDFQLSEPYDFPSNLPFYSNKTRIRGHLSDDDLIKVASLNSLRDRRFPLASLRCTQSQTSQTCHKVGTENPRVSSAKFPNLEGRVSSQITPAYRNHIRNPAIEEEGKVYIILTRDFASSKSTRLRLPRRRLQSLFFNGAVLMPFVAGVHPFARVGCGARYGAYPPSSRSCSFRTASGPSMRPTPSPTSSYSEEEPMLRDPG